MTNLNKSFALAAIQSTEQFPINLSDIWEGLGYHDKSTAKRAFDRCKFLENIEFCQVTERTVHKDSQGFDNTVVSQHIIMSADCFKHFCMATKTAKGKEVRLYFIEAEKELQALKQKQLPQRDAIEYIQASEKLELVNNLTLRELLRDELIDELSIKRSQKQLAAKPVQYTIVKVRAKEMGYTLKEIGNGSQLGKFVSKHVPIAFTERVGRYDVKHYEVNDSLDTAIKNFFGLKRAIA